MYKNNLIAENKIIITTSDSFCLKIFAVVMPPYLTFTTANVKIKLPSYIFSNSHGCNIGYCTRKLIVRLKFSPALSIYMIF